MLASLQANKLSRCIAVGTSSAIQDGKDTGESLSGITGKWIIVWGWENGQWSAKHATMPSLLPVLTLTNLYTGKAYRVKMKEAVEWSQ